MKPARKAKGPLPIDVVEAWASGATDDQLAKASADSLARSYGCTPAGAVTVIHTELKKRGRL